MVTSTSNEITKIDKDKPANKKTKDSFETLVQLNTNEANEMKLAEAVITVDLGHLLAFDPRPINVVDFKKDTNMYLSNYTTIATQLLVNKLYNLNVENVENVIVAKLPAPLTLIPREKPLPKEKPLTKWQQYAKLKGIQKKKKDRKVFDEATGEWRPAWGYKRKDDSTKDWLIEIKDNEDPYQDFYAKRNKEKSERVAKNELQRLRNVARSSKKKIPGVGITPTDMNNPDKPQV
jgi:regulator of ribosome biosynthesis